MESATRAECASAPRALVLAGKRGPTDALARSLGASHRAFVPVAGVTMLERVVATLVASGVEKITVSIDEPGLVESVAGLRRLVDEGRLVARTSAESPASSVLDFLRTGGDAALPALVTTADHPLLTAGNSRSVLARREPRGRGSRGRCRQRGHVSRALRRHAADVRPSRRRIVLGRESVRRLRGSGPRDLDFWRRAERHRKSPWRLARVFGVAPLLRFAAGRLTVADALETLARTTGARAALVKLPFAEAAIDVDRPADFETASRLLAAAAPGPARPA
jgi:CTP:molybdopterin cytidylyltransferase MocA